MSRSTLFGFRLLRFFVITSPTFEKRRSVGTDVAGMQQLPCSIGDDEIQDDSVSTSEADTACVQSLALPDNPPSSVEWPACWQVPCSPQDVACAWNSDASWLSAAALLLFLQLHRCLSRSQWFNKDLSHRNQDLCLTVSLIAICSNMR